MQAPASLRPTWRVSEEAFQCLTCSECLDLRQRVTVRVMQWRGTGPQMYVRCEKKKKRGLKCWQIVDVRRSSVTT